MDSIDLDGISIANITPDKMKEMIIALEKNKKNSEVTNQILHKLRPFRRHAVNNEIVGWLKEQVELGNSYAMDWLGDIYFYKIEDSIPTGHNSQRYKEAFGMFELGVKEGNSHSMYNLSYMYLNGKGCEADEAKSLELITRSCKANCAGGIRYFKQTIQLYKSINGYDQYMEHVRMQEEIRLLKEDNMKLAEQIQNLTTELEYMPGGVGYEKAKENAEMLFGMLQQSGIGDGVPKN